MPRRNDDDQREYLLIRGRLTRDDVFVPRRSGSTTVVRTWPEPEQPDHGDVVAETVDADGRVLRSERPSVLREGVCAPSAPTWRVRVYLPLDDNAAEVQLRRGERVLWSAPVGEKPEVRVEVLSIPARGRQKRKDQSEFPGGKPAVLGLEVSRAIDPAVAYVKIVYRWNERGFHTVYLGPARRRITIPADRLPGSGRCEFFVSYSDGVRSAIARTKPIKVAPIGPVVTIVRPAADMTITEGTPIDLECLVQDPESPSLPFRERNQTVWMVDGERVAVGALTSIDPLPPGTYRIDVEYAGSARRSGTTSRKLSVRRSRAVIANEWPDHDPFAD